MQKQITPEEFIKCWNQFTKEKLRLKDFEDKKERTRLIIGIDNSSHEGSPLGDHLVSYFGNDFRYRKEDGSVDLSFYKADFLKNVKDMNTEDKTKVLPQETLNNFPKFYDILVEQENQIEKAYEEMHKLTYYRSVIKVLITFIWAPSKTGDRWDYAHGRLRQNFETIIKQANERFPETSGTSYILITGQSISGKIEWNSSILWN